MSINWKIRIQSLDFWTSLIPAVLLLIQAIGAPLGLQLDFGELGNQLLAIVNAVFIYTFLSKSPLFLANSSCRT